MANYCCAIRTNYFHVKNAEEFRALMSRVYGCEDSVELWEEKNGNGESAFGFGTYGGIAGIRDSQDDEDDDINESSYDDFIDALQKCVADDDAIIILEAGNEKMRYVVGAASIITSKDYKYMDIASMAAQEAAKLLGNSAWTTRCYC